VKAAAGAHGVVGDGMVRKAVHVKQGDLCGEESRTGVRAPIAALTRGNARRAKGCRKVDAPPPGRRNRHEPVASALVAKPTGVARPSGARADTTVWTERMLTAPFGGCEGTRGSPQQARVVLHCRSLADVGQSSLR